jgi:hypothetical protein
MLLGVGWGMATAITLPTGDSAMFVLSRPTELGPFVRAAAARLDALRPHLARSVLISARLQLERARVVSQALALMGSRHWFLTTGARSWQRMP